MRLNKPQVLRAILMKRKRVATGRMVSQMLYAIKKGYAGCIQVFLEAGLSHQVVDHKNTPALELSVQYGHRDVACLLVRRDFKERGMSSLTDASLIAVKHNNLDLFKQIIKWGLRENTALLIEAVKYGRQSFCELYLKVFPESDVNEKPDGSHCALGLALQRSLVGVVDLLLANGADPNTRLEGGLGPILTYLKQFEHFRWDGTAWGPMNRRRRAMAVGATM